MKKNALPSLASSTLNLLLRGGCVVMSGALLSACNSSADIYPSAPQSQVSAIGIEQPILIPSPLPTTVNVNASVAYLPAAGRVSAMPLTVTATLTHEIDVATLQHPDAFGISCSGAGVYHLASVSLAGLSASVTLVADNAAVDGETCILSASGVGTDSVGATVTLAGSVAYVVDTSAPSVSASITNGATGIAVNSAIQFVFGADIDDSTVTAGHFTLTHLVLTMFPTFSLTPAPNQFAFAYDASSHTATLTPSDEMSSAGYTVSVLAGVKDQAGNAIVSVSINFTTAAAAPAIPDMCAIMINMPGCPGYMMPGMPGFPGSN